MEKKKWILSCLSPTWEIKVKAICLKKLQIVHSEFNSVGVTKSHNESEVNDVNIKFTK